jgi:outer membrane protein assembly factor BamD (BamD/ComL family)
MLEVYAKDLYETAKFYERTKKPKAAIIYYNKIVSKYPDTPTAIASQKRLEVLLPVYGVAEPSSKQEMPSGGVLVDNTPAESAQELQ